MSNTGGFGFNEAQEMYRRQVKEFAEKELKPEAQIRVKQELVAPNEVMRKLAKSGLFGLKLPEEYGGQESDWVTWAIGVEELAKVEFFAALTLIINFGACANVAHGTEEAKKEWLAPLIAGDKVGCFSLTEPGCG